MNKLLSLVLALAGLCSACGQKVSPVNTSNPAPSSHTNATELVTLGGGCFWCVEAIYQRIHGVKSVASGYAGGKTENPTYEEVCSGLTGHAEVIQIEFDPAQVSLANILNVFWLAHDPTTLNRQGADTGTQYRSVIFYRNDTQKQVAEKSKQAAAGSFKDPIVTQIVPFTKFFKAEDYHQSYFNNNPNQGYCTFVIRPKLEKVLKKLSHASETKP
jgi:peptide-methionine (S)-S-oxide reductase